MSDARVVTIAGNVAGRHWLTRVTSCLYGDGPSLHRAQVFCPPVSPVIELGPDNGGVLGLIREPHRAFNHSRHAVDHE